MKPILTKRFLICLTGIFLIVMVGVVEAIITFNLTVNPLQVYESSTNSFNLTISNPTDNVCVVNLSMPNFVVVSVFDLPDWTENNGTNWIYWNTTTNCITTTGSVVFPFQVKANLVDNNMNDSWTVWVENIDNSNNGSQIINITILDNTTNPIIFEATVTPNTVYEGTITTFNLTVNNNVGGNENICAINVSMPLFSVTSTSSFSGWTISNGTNWFYLNSTSPPGIGTGTIVTFVNIVQAKANLVTSDVNDTWNITADNCDFNSTNSTTSNITILNDAILPNITILQPTGYYNYTTGLPLNYTVQDAESGVSACWFSVDSGAENYSYFDCSNGTFNVGEGHHNITVFVNDTVGNIKNSTINFVVAAPGSTQISKNVIINATSGATNWVKYYENVLNESIGIKNLTFNSAESKIVWIRIPKNSNVTLAKINLTGYYTTDYPKNITIKIGNSVAFNSTNFLIIENSWLWGTYYSDYFGLGMSSGSNVVETSWIKNAVVDNTTSLSNITGSNIFDSNLTNTSIALSNIMENSNVYNNTGTMKCQDVYGSTISNSNFGSPGFLARGNTTFVGRNIRIEVVDPLCQQNDLFNISIKLNTTVINDYLATCTPDSNNLCDIPLNITSQTPGILQIDDINITYDYNVSELFTQDTNLGKYYWNQTDNVVIPNKYRQYFKTVNTSKKSPVNFSISVGGFYIHNQSKSIGDSCWINDILGTVQNDTSKSALYCNVSSLTLATEGDFWMTHNVSILEDLALVTTTPPVNRFGLDNFCTMGYGYVVNTTPGNWSLISDFNGSFGIQTWSVYLNNSSDSFTNVKLNASSNTSCLPSGYNLINTSIELGNTSTWNTDIPGYYNINDNVYYSKANIYVIPTISCPEDYENRSDHCYKQNSSASGLNVRINHYYRLWINVTDNSTQNVSIFLEFIPDWFVYVDKKDPSYDVYFVNGSSNNLGYGYGNSTSIQTLEIFPNFSTSSLIF